MRIDLSDLKILLVEDAPHMRRIVRSLLHGLGIRQIEEAEDGGMALDIYRQRVPDIILTDWVMPIVDGLEMTRIIRNPEGRDPYTPIIMMTGHTEKRKVEQARDCGVTEFVMKPLSAKSLYLRVVNCIEKPRPFVRTQTYFGPDRRRMKTPSYIGKRRRASDRQIAEELELDALLAEAFV